MTRTTDRELSEFAPYQGTRQRTDLCARTRMIKQYDADLFVSLHVNAASNTQLCGAITFYQRKSAESKLFAQYIQHAIQTVQPYNRQTILPGNFYLLNASPVPAVLLEIAFITHLREHALLQDSAFLQNMARQVTQGIYQYVTEANKATSSFELFYHILPRLIS
jgi:N-acetylmuramoyl-L-alanine amidase